MNLYKDICIQDETEFDRQSLLDCVRDPALGKDAHVIYVYTLVDGTVNYPNKEGRVLYIGEAGRPTDATGKRFAQHISTGPSEGGDSGTIYSLSRYYWSKRVIRLQIFLVNSKDERKRFERELLNAHVKEYGALPICQGTTGENYKTTVLAALNVTQEQLSLFQPASNSTLNHN